MVSDTRQSIKVVLLGTASGGTTAFSKCLLQHDDIEVQSEIIKKSNDDSFGNFYTANSNSKVLYTKEPLGPSMRQASFPIFPENLPTNLKTIFMFRDPVSVWNSWTKREWTRGIDALFYSYERLFDLQKQLKHKQIPTWSFCFENFLGDPESYLKFFCNFVEIDYSEKMLAWEKTWGQRSGSYGNPGIDTMSLQTKIAPPDAISEDDIKQIKKKLQSEINSICDSDIKHSREAP